MDDVKLSTINYQLPPTHFTLNMTALEQHLLAIIQDAFPLEERPYRRLAEVLNAQNARAVGDVRGHLTEQAVFDAVENLRRSGVVRRIGGIYDSLRLGFISRLCAGKVNDLDKFASAVNGIPAITHNYVRSHEYNVWFTVIAQSEDEISAVVDKLCTETDLHDVHILIATKKFKINTVMGTGVPECSSQLAVGSGDLANGRPWLKNPDPRSAQACVLSADDRSRIRIACDDIPHTLTPFADCSVSVDELREDLAKKTMRRFGAILRHQDAGFAYNAMVCFNVPADAGGILAQKTYVSHCYERPAFENFPYTLYAMMHAPSAEALDRYIWEAAESIGNPEYVVLHSVKELKKTSFRFFRT